MVATDPNGIFPPGGSNWWRPGKTRDPNSSRPRTLISPKSTRSPNSNILLHVALHRKEGPVPPHPSRREGVFRDPQPDNPGGDVEGRLSLHKQHLGPSGRLSSHEIRRIQHPDGYDPKPADQGGGREENGDRCVHWVRRGDGATLVQDGGAPASFQNSCIHVVRERGDVDLVRGCRSLGTGPVRPTVPRPGNPSGVDQAGTWDGQEVPKFARSPEYPVISPARVRSGIPLPLAQRQHPRETNRPNARKRP